MRAPRQLLIWMSVILALSLVLLNQLHDTSAIADGLRKEAQFDVMRIDLTSLLSESNSLESHEKSNEEPIAESQLTETTTEVLESAKE